MGRCDLQAELGGLLPEELDLLLAASYFVVLRAFVDVVLTILQHAIEQSGEPMGHSGDGFRSAKLAAQASVLSPKVGALSQHVRKLPATLRRSLTWDRELEMAKHKEFTIATDVQVYFCDPQSPWQRGSKEDTNLLLRHDRPSSSV
jgi:hypothetical protein